MRILCFIMMMISSPLAAQELNGHFTQGGMVIGKADPGARILLDGNAVQVSAAGDFVIGFGRDHGATSTLTMIKADGSKVEKTLSITKRKYNVERIDGLPENTVTPPASWTARRKEELNNIFVARTRKHDAMDWKGTFILPSKGRLSGVYGSQRILNGKPRSPHYGLDVAAPTGTPVLATADGIVRLVATDYLLQGGVVIIDHGFGITSSFYHLSAVDVSVGMTVKQGQKIGEIGMSGRATGPHIDWRVYWRYTPLDPALLVSEEELKQ